MCLAINESKTKYLMFNRKEYPSANYAMDNFRFEAVKNFVYLGSRVNSSNNNSLEINHRNILGNIYFGVFEKKVLGE